MKKRRYRSCWFAVVALVSTAGCVNVSVDRGQLERRYFVLDVTPEKVPAGANSAGVLKVSNVRVAPRYDGKSFVYRTDDMSYETDYYNQFLVPPGAMLTGEVRQALIQANVFHYVVDSDSHLQATHRLEGTVDALYGDFSDKTSPEAVLAVSFLLSLEDAAGPKVVFQKRYQQTVPVKKRTPEALVRGWNEGLETILGSLIADLRPAATQAQK